MTMKAKPEMIEAAWLPIAKADREIVHQQHFPEIGITIRNSDRYWVRDSDGRVYEASWTEDGKGRDHWWDWENESPVDPVEFMPHPLDPRFVAAQPQPMAVPEPEKIRTLVEQALHCTLGFSIKQVDITDAMRNLRDAALDVERILSMLSTPPADLHRLREENDHLTQRLNHYIKATTAKNSDLIAAEARVKVLEETLEWYGEQARLARLITGEGDPGRWALADDGGKRAEAALKGGA